MTGGGYARYGGGGKGDTGSVPGRGPYQFQGYSDIRDIGPQSTTTLEPKKDITLDSESERSANWKD